MADGAVEEGFGHDDGPGRLDGGLGRRHQVGARVKRVKLRGFAERIDYGSSLETPSRAFIKPPATRVVVDWVVRNASPDAQLPLPEEHGPGNSSLN